MQTEEFYTYMYFDPRKPGKYQFDDLLFDFEPIYVGKGKGTRCFEHLKDNTQTIKATKIKKIIKEGYDPIIVKIQENISEYEAKKLEAEIMKKIGTIVEIECLPRGPLTNTRYTSSFESDCLSEETKHKLSEIGKNRWSEEKKQKRSAEMKDMWAEEEYRKSQIDKISNGVQKEEFKKANSERSKQLWEDPSYREKQKETRNNPEYKKKMNKSLSGKTRTDEQKKLMSLIQKEVMKNKDLRDRISKSIKGRKQIYNSLLDQSKVVHEQELQFYLDQGWILGRKPGRKNKKKRKQVTWKVTLNSGDIIIYNDKSLSDIAEIHNYSFSRLNNQRSGAVKFKSTDAIIGLEILS